MNEMMGMLGAMTEAIRIMKIAEKIAMEYDKASFGNPEAKLILKSFMISASLPNPALADKIDPILDHHAREMLARVIKRESIVSATRADILSVCIDIVATADKTDDGMMFKIPMKEGGRIYEADDIVGLVTHLSLEIVGNELSGTTLPTALVHAADVGKDKMEAMIMDYRELHSSPMREIFKDKVFSELGTLPNGLPSGEATC